MEFIVLIAWLSAHHATLPCEQLKDYVSAFGRQTVINGAKRHGYSEATIKEVLRRCNV